MTTTFQQAVRAVAAAAVVIAATTSGVTAAALEVSIGGVVQKAGAVEVTATDLVTGLEGPPAAVVTLPGGSAPRIGDSLHVAAPDGAGGVTAIFKGEIVGVEPVFDASGKSGFSVRGLNKLHRLTRGRKSRTFENQRDSDIVHAIAKEHGLVAVVDLDDDPRYDRVFQHNQTDLEFLLTRANRRGIKVWTEDELLNFRRPAWTPEWRAACGQRGDVALRQFHPRLSSMDQVRKVTVRGWNPEKKEEIVGEASVRRLTPSRGAAAGSGKEVDLGRFEAASTETQAHAVARAMLLDLTAGELPGELATDGDARLMPGGRIRVTEPSLSAFDGELEIVEAQHRTGGGGGGGGYTTVLRVRRDDRGMYVVPQVGDEVLVEFPRGDVSKPYVIGSLWNGKDKVPPTACSAVPGGDASK